MVWLHVELRAAGPSTMCIETRLANAAMKAMPNKTDRNDARALAQIMRTGWFRQVHVKSLRCQLWRSLLVARRTVLNEMRVIRRQSHIISPRSKPMAEWRCPTDMPCMGRAISLFHGLQQ